jgi:hypothetical protein
MSDNPVFPTLKSNAAYFAVVGDFVLLAASFRFSVEAAILVK